MSAIKFHKVVGSLPGTLEANSVYFLRTGAGFSIHITNDIGQVTAYSLNSSSITPEGSVYWEFIYSGDDIGTINKWDSKTKVSHLLNISFVWNNGLPTSILMTDWVKAVTTEFTFTWLDGKVIDIQVDRTY